MYNEDIMKRSAAKSKPMVAGRTKLSEVLRATGEVGGRYRPETRIAGILGRGATVRTSDVRKKRRGTIDPRVLEYAEVLAHAVDTFGSRTRANSWLNRPSRIFNNQSPLQVLTENPAAVEEELVRIDYGMFA